MKRLFIFCYFVIISSAVYSQSCAILSKANLITPDKLCSPVSVSWNVSYTGVMDSGTPVEIYFDWNDGNIQTIPANKVANGVFDATISHTYTSSGNVCNYHPRATLIVNGVLCTSSSQEQIVTVWDNDDHNGGHMHISPDVYPICVGKGDNVRFQDLTQFNCVPPQENDVPNLFTRWVQWIYGTDNTMTGIPVTIDGVGRTFPYAAPVITLPGPVTGSGVYSGFIKVFNDKLTGQYFQVTLRNWNYCNPYDDPNNPGPPADLVNGDHPPVLTTAIILIVPYPDATINPVADMCLHSSKVKLTAHDAGGTWSGPGITGDMFDPEVAGTGTHTINYSVTTTGGCTDTRQSTVTVLPSPDATIIPPGNMCLNQDPITLRANDAGGTWTGPGVAGNIFDPAIAGAGTHIINYTISSGNGCFDMDQTTITVFHLPDATIVPVDTLCVNSPPVTLTATEAGGVWSGAVSTDIFDPASAGAGTHFVNYKIINATGCSDSDRISITVIPVLVVNITPVKTLYLESPAVTLVATPAGGIFSGAGVTGSIFNPLKAGTGMHVIRYQTTPDKFGCAANDTIRITVITPPQPVADFAPDTSGCSPLKVHFSNYSINAETYLWDFGDNVYSTQREPDHVYYMPGEFIVSLTVTNISGQSVQYHRISVYQNPSAMFSVYPTEVISNAQIVVLTNNSFYNDSQLWRFGDGTTSTEVTPWHKYEAEGTYDITLIVTTKQGCKDSSNFITPVHVQFRTGTIRFPNAFVWNQSGPTGGYWAEGEPDDHIFRPHFENVIEYKMQIFNRWGVLIYESVDLHQGWDGYFNNGNLALEDVYVWKVTGRYIDGTYIKEVGDVTFLH